MRIIGGRWKGRRLQLPSKNWPVRPTTDFAREALFNILDNRLDYTQISALDLFGGTGIHSLELASRGCKDITYVDRHSGSVQFMKSLISEWKLPVTAERSDVLSFLKKSSRAWDYIFADPPYDMVDKLEILKLIFENEILKPDGLLVLEHSSRDAFEDQTFFSEARKYGQSVFSFFTL